MNTTITHVVPVEVAGVCALALGLGYAAKSDQACVQELLAGARGSVITLRQARESLDEMAVTDPAARQRTCRLWDLASRMALDQPVSDTDPALAQKPARPSDSHPSRGTLFAYREVRPVDGRTESPLAGSSRT